MKDTLKAGDTYEETFEIDRDRTIAFMGDELRVYATPSMVLDIEHTCRNALLEHHDDDEDSVGARIEVDHLGPTLLGQKVTVKTTVAEVSGPKVVFDAEVFDELDKVGQGRHIRFAINKTKQGERLKQKKAKLA